MACNAGWAAPFRTCGVHFLAEGHAHEDIDQLLAVILELVMRGGMMSCHCCMGLRPTNGGVQHHGLPGITDNETSEKSQDIISQDGFENARAAGLLEALAELM